MRDLEYDGERVRGDFDRAVSWMYTYTAEADPTQDVCLNCHNDESHEVSQNEEHWLEHADKGRTSRLTMDKVEISLLGHVAGDPDAGQGPLRTVCRACHSDESDEV